MSNYLSSFFAGSSDAENSENQTRRNATQRNAEETENQTLTRSRAAALGLQVPSPFGPGRAKSRSPSPLPPPGQQFFPPSTNNPYLNMPNDGDQAAAPTDAETLRAVTEALQGLRTNTKKPELPAFDIKNIELWIRRVESAYIRAGIERPREKFAHLENKIGVDVDPRINNFLYGATTEERWTEFTDYLKKQYGRTKQQKAQTLIDGIPRDGRRPSQLWALYDERTSGCSLDDVIKEQIMRQLPAEVQRSIAEKTADMTSFQTAEVADHYFDREGRILHKSASSINAVSDGPPGLVDSDHEDASDVNAVGFGRNKRQRGPWNPKQPTAPKAQPRNAPNQPKAEGNGGSRLRNICHYHYKFGEKARMCQPDCCMNKQWKEASNGQASRRT